MLSRRSHRKSRFGCKKCKARKLKCDEIHPICGNCFKHKISCDFAPPKDDERIRLLEPMKIVPLQKWLKSEGSEGTTSRDDFSMSRSNSDTVSRLSATPPVTRKGSFSPNASSELSNSGEMAQFSDRGFQYFPGPATVPTPVDRLLELRLFHHYFEMTASYSVSSLAEIPVTAPGRNVWAVWVTGLALSSQSLMDALLAFSASHLRYINPLDREISQASHRYMMRALNRHAQEVRKGLDEKNAEAVFATSTFVAFHSSMGQKFLVGQGVRGPPLHWFRPYQGIKAVLEAGWQWIQKSSIQPLLQSGIEYISTSPKEQRHKFEGQELPFDFLLEGLSLEEHDAETIDAYESTVSHLNYLSLSLVVSHILRFPAIVSGHFVDMLEAQDPRSLTIVGYFFMVLKRVESAWWLRGTVDHEFQTLMSLLPQKWWPKMEWAMREFGWVHHSTLIERKRSSFK